MSLWGVGNTEDCDGCSEECSHCGNNAVASVDISVNVGGTRKVR